MLNLSDNSIRHLVNTAELESYEKVRLEKIHLSAKRLLLIFAAIIVVFLLLPWTQNIQAGGKLSTLQPEHRPQTVHATISGRIERWYVREGQEVRRGDTIVYLSEVASDYFDPNLVPRTDEQVSAKQQAITAYDEKVRALESQVTAMQAELTAKTAQIRNKIGQTELKVKSDEQELERAKADRQIAQRQLDGTKALYDKGIKSLTELEEKRLKVQETSAKLISAENKLGISRAELDNYRNELSLAQNETANKVAKARSDKFTALSDRYDAEATVAKLEITRENYQRRAGFYYITAPQDGYVVQALAAGLGEIIKAGDPVVSILPSGYQLAVEMYVQPIDMPLLHTGSPVRFIFDGWPAFFFSGWPGQSLGTYAGRVAAIDRNISANGKFRVLVAPDPAEAPWPAELRVGGGAKGIALLNDVPLWYELWRILNGFPPNFYTDLTAEKNSEKKKAEDTPAK